MNKLEVGLLSVIVISFAALLQYFIYLEQGLSVGFFMTLILYIVVTVVGIAILYRIK